ADAGWYTLSAINEAGMSTCNARLDLALVSTVTGATESTTDGSQRSTRPSEPPGTRGMFGWSSSHSRTKRSQWGATVSTAPPLASICRDIVTMATALANTPIRDTLVLTNPDDPTHEDSAPWLQNPETAQLLESPGPARCGPPRPPPAQHTAPLYESEEL
ncbi:unnamed protein product, partial [Boreogadus saida]